VPILVKIDQEMRRESAYKRTDRLTDANRFYNLSHAICHAIGQIKINYRSANIHAVPSMVSLIHVHEDIHLQYDEIRLDHLIFIQLLR